MAGNWGGDPLNVAVANLPSTQTVAGAVTVSGTVTTTPSGTQTVEGTLTAIPFVSETKTAKGTATTTANASDIGRVVATVSSPGAGFYKVEVNCRFDGGTVTGATDAGNFEVRVNNVSKFRCVALPSSAVSTAFTQTTGYVSASAGNDITVNIVAASSNASSIYSALINVTRVN